MLELEDEENPEPSMNQDMIRFLDFCCENNLFIHCMKKEICIYEIMTDKWIMDFNFSDLYYPKNLLRTLKEKLSEKVECPTV